MRIRLALACSLVLSAGCGSSSSSPSSNSGDAKTPAPDATIQPDTRPAADAPTGGPDLSTLPDLAVLPDAAIVPDRPPDVTTAPDVTVAPETPDAMDVTVAVDAQMVPDVPAEPDALAARDVGRDVASPDRRYNLAVDVECMNPCLACVRTKCEPDGPSWASDQACTSFATCIESCPCTQTNCGESCSVNPGCSVVSCLKEMCKAECSVGGTVQDSLPACPSDHAGMLTAPIMDLNHVAALVPLGNAAPPLHVFPVDHTYFNAYPQTSCTASTCGSTPYYSPGNGTIIQVRSYVNHYSSAPDEKSIAIDLALCNKVVLTLGGLDDMSTMLKTALLDAWPVCQSQPPKHVDETSIENCVYLTNIPVAAGAQLGTTGGTEFPEIWAYDYTLTPEADIHWDKYNYRGYAYATCYLDLYTGAQKAAHYAKLGNYNNGIFAPRTVSPLCGSSRQTIVGTAQGDWFLSALGGWDNPANGMGVGDLALEHNNFDPTLGEWVIGGTFAPSGIVLFTPKHSGTTDREFSEVTPGDTIYCYNDPNGTSPLKYLLKLVDSQHLQVEKQNGTCGNSEAFVSATAYER